MKLYSNLSNTNIILSNYPKYNKEEVYTLEENLIDKVILDITSIRNLKLLIILLKMLLLNLKQVMSYMLYLKLIKNK